MQVTKAIDSLADRLAPYAWRDDVNSLKAKAEGNCYEWHFSYASQFHPRVVLEIGVQRGYSAIAFLMGHPGIECLYLFDNEADGFSLAEAVQHIGKARTDLGAKTSIYSCRMDTQKGQLFVPLSVGLAHIDGLHTFEGVTRDLSLVFPLTGPGGVILLDDLWIPEVRAAADRFAKDHPEWEHVIIPSHTTHQLSVRPL